MSSYRMKYKIGATQYHIPVVDDMAGFGSGIPLGTILPYSANSEYPPEGFLWCDGSAISRAMYPDLFALVGITFGEGDGETTFNLPDLSGGEFLEGSDIAGTSKEAGIPNIKGTDPSIASSGTGSSTGAFRSSVGHPTVFTRGSDYPRMVLEFDASRCSSVYKDDVTTVQPKSVTVKFIIKAFSATTSSSELIDITQYASALNQKLTENDIYGNNFTVLYPNRVGDNFPYISVNSRVVVSNPFPGYYIRAFVEILYSNQWGEVGWIWLDSSTKGSGIVARQLNDDTLVIQSGYGRTHYNGSFDQGDPFGKGAGTGEDGSYYRVKVWKIGKIPT